MPLILECLDANGKSSILQAKVAASRNGLGERELVREILGTVFAHIVGIQVSAPAWIKLVPDVAQEIEDVYNMGLRESLCAGVEWVTYLRPFVVPVDINHALTTSSGGGDLSSNAAVRLLAFDLLLANGDRTVLNPNIAWDSTSLFSFDFEHCLLLREQDFARMFEVHCKLLVNLRESHIFGSAVPLAYLKFHISQCLDRLERRPDINPEMDDFPENFQKAGHWMAS